MSARLPVVARCYYGATDVTHASKSGTVGRVCKADPDALPVPQHVALDPEAVIAWWVDRATDPRGSGREATED